MARAKFDPRSGARSVARKLALQALYQLQINDVPWQDLVAEYSTAEDMPKADRDYFIELVREVAQAREALDAHIAGWTDRPPAELDPIEHAVLLVGTYELIHRPDVPYRVVITEGVTLTRRFGATDGHKFVNAVLDRAARELRVSEH
jgi:N utilization substance protein B